MKIAAKISDDRYLVEVSMQELGNIMGKDYIAYNTQLKTGQIIPISPLWKIIGDTRQRTQQLQDGAKLLNSIAASINYAAATLDPPPAPEQTEGSNGGAA